MPERISPLDVQIIHPQQVSLNCHVWSKSLLATQVTVGS